VIDEAERTVLAFDMNYTELTVSITKDTHFYPAANALVFAAHAIHAVDNAMTMQHETLADVFEQTVTFEAH
jgi:hypothetical protein